MMFAAPPSVVDEIKSLQNRWHEAAIAGDVDRMMQLYTKDALVQRMSTTLSGLDAIRQELNSMVKVAKNLTMESFQFNWEEILIDQQMGEKANLVHYWGKSISNPGITTFCLVLKINSQWLYNKVIIVNTNQEQQKDA